jgi:TonB family protein
MLLPFRSRLTLLFLGVLSFGGSALLGGCQQESDSAADASSETSLSGEVYTVVSHQPDCGGVEPLQEYVENNPPEPFWPWTETEGRVLTQFVVTKEGEVVNPKVTRGVNDPLNSTAIAAVQHLDCTPGTQEGKRVHVQMSLPVPFRE